MTKKWKVEEFCGSLLVVDDKGDVVAALSYPNDEKIAMLMASAPDLLEALKLLLEDADSTCESYDIAKAAIAKATGEPQ